MGPRDAPTTCHNQHGASRSYHTILMSWSREDLCTNSYVRSTRFSLLSKLPSCTHYISNVGIKTGLNYFQNFPYVTTFLLRSISVFYLWKTEWFRKELSPSEKVFFWMHNFGKRSFSEILDQCDFGKNGVWRIFLDSLLSHFLLRKKFRTARFRKEWSLTKIFGKLTIAFTWNKHLLGESGPKQFRKELIPNSIPTLESLNKTFKQSLHIIFAKQHLFSLYFFLF